MTRLPQTAAAILATAPPLPLDADHWQRVVEAIGFSKRQAEVAELMLRDLADKQIALVLGINEATIDTHTERIGKRTGTKGRMQLAMHVLAVSHHVLK